MTPGEPVEIAGDGPARRRHRLRDQAQHHPPAERARLPVTLLPCDTSAEEILGRDPDLVFLANGPGDPGALDYVVENVRGVVGKKPVVGICLGHQLLCRAVGPTPTSSTSATAAATSRSRTSTPAASTSPPRTTASPSPAPAARHDRGRRARPLDTDFGEAELSHLNLYDRTVEGLVLKDVPGCTVQYHPEAGPGPHDARYLFDRFLELAEKS